MRRTNAGDGGARRRIPRWGFVIAAVLIGYYFGLRLDEERRSRLRKLVNEGLEMPFRLFL